MTAASIDSIGRVRTDSGTGWRYVGWSGDRAFALEGDPFDGSATPGEEFDVAASSLLAPVRPPKIVATAVNYVSHAIKRDPPTKPELFYKPITSIADPGTSVVFPDGAADVDAEGEIVLVIGRRATQLTPENAADHILGWTAGYDISARNFQREDRHFWRAKGSDTFTPLGPRIALGAPGPEVGLVNRVNGEEKQRTTVGDMIFSPVELLVFATRHVTLEPGDLFFTGTPGVTPRIVSGDSIALDVDGVGTLAMDIA